MVTAWTLFPTLRKSSGQTGMLDCIDSIPADYGWRGVSPGSERDFVFCGLRKAPMTALIADFPPSLIFRCFFTLRDVLLRNAPAGRIATCCGTMLVCACRKCWSRFLRIMMWRVLRAEGSSPAKVRTGIRLTLTLRGIPEIYYGDEIGMPGAAIQTSGAISPADGMEIRTTRSRKLPHTRATRDFSLMCRRC